MDNDDLRRTCTKCKGLYRSSPQVERYRASAGHAGLCEACTRIEQEHAVDEGLALCAAKMLLIDHRFKPPPKP